MCTIYGKWTPANRGLPSRKVDHLYRGFELVTFRVKRYDTLQILQLPRCSPVVADVLNPWGIVMYIVHSLFSLFGLNDLRLSS